MIENQERTKNLQPHTPSQDSQLSGSSEDRQTKLEKHYQKVLQESVYYSDDDYDNYSKYSKSERLKCSLGSNNEKSALQPSDKALLHKYENKISLEVLDKNNNSTVYVKDKSDRATVENVLDARTRAVIFKKVWIFDKIVI